ncbi:MAG TPA: hypothetical protein VJA27_00770 [Patescibacteria group bacterium]|nr:hypothetical protein [Patescibacteria group bacterium]
MPGDGLSRYHPVRSAQSGHGLVPGSRWRALLLPLLPAAAAPRLPYLAQREGDVGTGAVRVGGGAWRDWLDSGAVEHEIAHGNGKTARPLVLLVIKIVSRRKKISRLNRDIFIL